MSWIKGFISIVTGSSSNDDGQQHDRYKVPYSERKSGKHVHDWAHRNTGSNRYREGSTGEHTPRRNRGDKK